MGHRGLGEPGSESPDSVICMEPAFIILGVVVCVAVVARGVAWLKDRSDPIDHTWWGQVVAIRVSVIRAGGEVDLSVAPVLRRQVMGSDGVEDSHVDAPWSDASDLPLAVREQVFSPAWVVNAGSPNLNIADRSMRQYAIKQAQQRDGSYEFTLRQPLTVEVEQFSSGRLRIDW